MIQIRIYSVINIKYVEGLLESISARTTKSAGSSKNSDTASQILTCGKRFREKLEIKPKTQKLAEKNTVSLFGRNAYIKGHP